MEIPHQKKTLLFGFGKFFYQRPESFLDRHDPGCFIGIRPSKGVSILHIPFKSVISGRNDAIRTFGNITCFDTIERTFFRLFLPLFDLLYKFRKNSSSRHPDRTFDNLNVLFMGIDIRLFEYLGSVTFLGSDKTGSHLYPVCPQFHNPTYILSRINSSSSNNRNLFTVFFFNFPGFFYHFRSNML